MAANWLEGAKGILGSGPTAPQESKYRSYTSGEVIPFANGAYLDQATNRWYFPQYAQGERSANNDAASDYGAQTGWYGVDNAPNQRNNTGYAYDLDGNQTGTFKDSYGADDPKSPHNVGGKLTLAMIAAMGGGAALSGLSGAGAASGAGLGTGNGAFLGEAAWAPTAGSVPLEFGAATTGLTEGGGLLSKAALDGTTAFGANSIPGALDISALSAATTPAAASEAVASIAKSLGYTGPASGLTQFMNGLPEAVKSALPSGVKSLLGPAMTLLGAASGTDGGSGGGGGGRTLDPRMESYLYDANGLMPMTQGLLQRQAPIAEQNGQLLGDRSRGLLGRGVAVNPFLRG